jgi:hypothetical protein
MAEYQIKRWDVVLVNDQRVPMIYIKPDLDLVEFLRKNNFKVIVKIKNTDTVYDNKDIQAVVNLSANVPNCRPNFYDQTGYYVAILNSSWNGYPNPDKLGSASFYGVY